METPKLYKSTQIQYFQFG